MKKHILNIIPVLILMCFSTLVSAQGEAPVTTGGNDFMGGNLKIYVSVAVLTIILLLIFFFLFYMERRVKKLEQEEK